VREQDENERVYQYLRAQGLEHAYFGLADYDNTGTWEWTTGEVSSFTNWTRGQPDGNEEERYGMFWDEVDEGYSSAWTKVMTSKKVQ
jgi:hypothetical protein